MKSTLYKIRALTNLHAGSGDNNYSVIDNLIQRDPATKLPCIHGSSLKGALKEYMEYKWSKEDVEHKWSKEDMEALFGNESKQSKIKCLSAELIALPLRSNKRSYFLAICPSMLSKMNENLAITDNALDLTALLDISPEENRPVVINQSIHNLIIEDFDILDKVDLDKELPRQFGPKEGLVLLHETDWIRICDDMHLPVIARNRVGENKNLWYEQVLPRESILFARIFGNDAVGYSDFEDEITGDKTLIHIGANATVGYGFTQFEKV